MQALYETTVVEAELSRKAKLSICSPLSTVWSFGQWAAERMSSLIKCLKLVFSMGWLGLTLTFHIWYRFLVFVFITDSLCTLSPLFAISWNTLHASFLLQLELCCFLEKGIKIYFCGAKWYIGCISTVFIKIHHHQSKFLIHLYCGAFFNTVSDKWEQIGMLKCYG